MIYDQILDYDDRTRQIAERAISLLLTLRHHLSNEAFISAVCAGYDDELDETTLLDICCNLITCDNGFRFVHLSAQEFVLQRPEYFAAHLRNAVPARACLSIFFSSEQSSSLDDYIMWETRIDCFAKYAFRFLGKHLSILDSSLANAPEASIEESLRSVIKRFLLWQPDFPFQRLRYPDCNEPLSWGCAEFMASLERLASHPLTFMAVFNLKMLPVQAGILVPCNGRIEGYLPPLSERAHDGEPKTRLSRFLKYPHASDWYLFLTIHGLYIAEDIVPRYTLLAKRSPEYFEKFSSLGHRKSALEVFQEFLEIRDGKCVEIMLLAYPDLKISFDMLDEACKSPLTLEAKCDLFSRYLRQNHPNGLPNLNMADRLDIIRLAVEKEPELTGNMEFLIDI